MAPGSLSPPPPGPPRGATGRAAAAAVAATVAQAFTQGTAPRNVASLPGTPEAGRGFRTARRRSLSLTPGASARGSSPCGSVAGSLRSGSSTTAPSSSPERSFAILPETRRKEHQQVQDYMGAFTHPSFGHADIPIVVTLLTTSEGNWSTLGQSERITVQRDGKTIRLKDERCATTFDGHEIIGGTLIGTVSQNGVPGGQFQLQPCKAPLPRTKSPLARPALVKRTCIHKHAQVPVVTRWCAVGIPSMLVVAPAEVEWHNSYQVAF